LFFILLLIIFKNFDRRYVIVQFSNFEVLTDKLLLSSNARHLISTKFTFNNREELFKLQAIEELLYD